VLHEPHANCNDKTYYEHDINQHVDDANEVETGFQVARPSASEIAASLNDQIAFLTRELLGQPNKRLSRKGELRYGKRGSLAIEIAGSKRGRWFDHEQGCGGDGLKLVRHCKQMEIGEAIDWARRWLAPKANGSADQSTNGGSDAGTEDATDSTTDADSDASATRFADIIASIEGITGTPVEAYLRSRGITANLPACIRYRRRAYGQYGALVALATNAEGKPLALQQVYLTSDGQKAPLAVIKRTNKAVDGWAEVSAVRLPGKLPLILAEGVETALSIWMATGQETWACLGIANVGHAPVPAGAAVVVARDGDEDGSKADQTIRKAAASLAERGHSVSMATPPLGQDFNDVLLETGAEAVRKLINEAEAVEVTERALSIGSDVEMARCVRDDLIKQHGEIVYAEGSSWLYCGTHWEPMPEHEQRRAVHAYDGVIVNKSSMIRLGKGRIDSVLNECAALCADPGFFDTRPVGINCATGFIRFEADGAPTIEPHHREHRCRHTLPGRWQMGTSSIPPKGSLMFKLLDGVFQGDAEAAEKVALLSEVCGSAALGYATKLMQPRAVILFGQTAENGKSQVLDLARGLLPPNAVCCLPAGRMGDERHITGLVGKLLNAADELSASAIATDIFKAVVTGEPIEGRDVYKPRMEFRPIAQNLFATNNLPPFSGGMDRGVQRRLLVVPFNRTIPVEERVENIGRRIAAEEADLLLAWATEGASRLIRQRNFTLPPSCKQALTDWLYGADPVLAWLDECVVVEPVVDGKPSIKTRKAYDHFKQWAVAEGFKGDKLPAINGFTQRVVANKTGVEYRRNATGRRFLGLKIIRLA
jgi:P4 family phage/plasmid primase-like protien